MKCKKCNAENNDENKFCIECGAELISEKSPHIKFCPACGFENIKEAVFCSNCGNNFSGKKINPLNKNGKNRNKSGRRIRKQSKELNFLNIIKEHKLITTLVIAFLVFLVYQSIPHTSEYKNSEYSTNFAANSMTGVMSDSVAAAVVSKFICGCGKCTDPLDVCTCETASEERSFIKAEIAKNISEEGIVLAMVDKYGGLKDKYSSELNNSKTGLRLPPVNKTTGFPAK